MRANGTKTAERRPSAPPDSKPRRVSAEGVIDLCCRSCFDVRDGTITPDVANAIANAAHAAARVAGRAEKINEALSHASTGAGATDARARRKAELIFELHRIQSEEVLDDK